VNKTDLAPHVGVDLRQMVADAHAARGGRPVIALSRQDRVSVESLTAWVVNQLDAHRDGCLLPQDPGPMAPHFHGEVVHTHGVGDHDHPAA
jgi:urease accessory protein